MGRRREGNYTQKNSTEDLVGNEENGNPLPDPNKTMMNVINKPNDAQKKKIPQSGHHGRDH
jgi:hypothetical protein